MKTEPGSEPDWLLCRIGERLLAVPLAAVLETMRPMPLASIIGLPSFVLGVSTIRGEVLPVIDAADLLGAGKCPITRFVTISTGPRTIALAVGSVVGIRRLTDDELQELPPLLHSLERSVLASIGTLDDSLLLTLDRSHLVPDTVWATLSEQVTTS